MHIKIFKNKNISRLIQIAVYLASFAFVHFVMANISSSAKNASTFIEYVLIILLARSLFLLLSPYTKHFFKIIAKVLLSPLDVIRRKFFEIAKRRQRFIKGSDESKLVFDFNIINKLKENLMFRKKLNLKSNSENIEKIKFLYIKLILILLKNNYDIKDSYTPKEIKNKLYCENNDILFDVYEQVRYSDNITVSEDTVMLCENTLADMK